VGSQASHAVNLFPYQQEGVRWLADRQLALLADEPGLGKSAQIVRAADVIGAQRILLLCSASIRMNWTREFAKFSERGVATLPLMTAANLPDAFPTGCMISSYDLIRNSSVISWLRSQKWDLLVLDEAHYCKGTDARRTQMILGVDGLIHRATRTWALTGTPAPNHAGELYPLMRCFGRASGSYSAWIEQFCITRPTPFGVKIIGSKNIPELRALIAPVILRRKKADVMAELPRVKFEYLTVEAGPVDEQLHFDDFQHAPATPEVLHRKIAQQNGILQAALQLTGLGGEGVAFLESIRDKVTVTRRYTGLSKLPAVVQIVGDELASNAYQKIVIFAVHKSVVEEIRWQLRRFHPVSLYGATPANKRQKNIDTFVNDPECRIFVGNVESGGTGVDGLQRVCDQCMFIEQDWVPGRNAQAVMRLNRIGQTKPVTVRIVEVANSTDEMVQRALKRKTADILAMFD